MWIVWPEFWKQHYIFDFVLASTNQKELAILFHSLKRQALNNSNIQKIHQIVSLHIHVGCWIQHLISMNAIFGNGVTVADNVRSNKLDNKLFEYFVGVLAARFSTQLLLSCLQFLGTLIRVNIKWVKSMSVSLRVIFIFGQNSSFHIVIIESSMSMCMHSPLALPVSSGIK